MRRILHQVTREAIIVLVVVLAVSLIFNRVRNGGIPLIADAETFRVRTDAEFAKVEDAHRLFEEGRAVFVDAREPAVFSMGHVEGAINAPPSSQGVGDLVWLASADTYVICYASEQNQREAGIVADRLTEMGSEKVYILLGGFEVWEKRGLPTQKGGG